MLLWLRLHHQDIFGYYVLTPSYLREYLMKHKSNHYKYTAFEKSADTNRVIIMNNVHASQLDRLNLLPHVLI